MSWEERDTLSECNNRSDGEGCLVSNNRIWRGDLIREAVTVTQAQMQWWETPKCVLGTECNCESWCSIFQVSVIHELS